MDSPLIIPVDLDLARKKVTDFLGMMRHPFIQSLVLTEHHDPSNFFVDTALRCHAHRHDRQTLHFPSNEAHSGRFRVLPQIVDGNNGEFAVVEYLHIYIRLINVVLKALVAALDTGKYFRQLQINGGQRIAGILHEIDDKSVYSRYPEYLF